MKDAREALSSPGIELLLSGELVLQESASIIAGVLSADVYEGVFCVFMLPIGRLNIWLVLSKEQMDCRLGFENTE